MRRPLDFSKIHTAALPALPALCTRGMPGGKRVGREYVTLNPTRPDRCAGSFKVNLQTGRWADFATGDKGGDVVSLAAYCSGFANPMRPGDWPMRSEFRRARAVHDVAEADAPLAPLKPDEILPVTAPASEGALVLPVPPHAPPGPQTHFTLGRPSAQWCYRNADGALLFHVLRFDKADGDKEFLPLTLWRNAQALHWRWSRPSSSGGYHG
jgi:putative DNA primase/helicase